MNGSSHRCTGCSDEKVLLRVLQCEHKLCESCCKKYFQEKDVGDEKVQSTIGYIICPTELKLTVLANGLEDIGELPTKICMDLLCDNCSENRPLNSHWWCDNCNETVCSWCAMQNHRSHACTAWKDGEIAQGCLQMIDPFLKYSPRNAETEVDEFCTKLATELKTRLHGFSEIKHAADSMKHVFGNKNTTTTNMEYQKQIDKLSKKLQIMNLIVSSVDQKLAYDVERVNNLCKSLPDKELHIPPVDTVADLFFKETHIQCKTEEKINAVSQNFETNAGNSSVSPKNGAVDNYKPLETANPELPGVKDIEIVWQLHLKSAFEKPLNICAIPNNGVVVLDDYGVHLMNQRLEYLNCVGWSPTMRTSVVPSATYHPTRNSIFILREIRNNRDEHGKKIIERQIPTLTLLSKIAYPDFKDDAKRLLGVTKSGRVVCATSSAIWVKNMDKLNNNGTIVWHHSPTEKLESFTEFVVGPSVHASTEEFYIIGSKTLYNFSYILGNGNEFCILKRKIASDVYSPILRIRNVVYSLKKDRTELIPVTSNRLQASTMKVQFLKDSSLSDKVMMSSDDTGVYLLNHSKNILYKATLLNTL